jgi:hypothetical protein
VAYGRERGLSARRACTLFSVARSALSYCSRKAVKDAEMVERMQALAAQYPRYGYRRIRIFLDRDGYRMSPGRMYRLWRLAKLQVPRKRRRKRVASSRPRPLAPTAMNQVWSYDFVFDCCANGQQLKCLTVTDEFTKYLGPARLAPLHHRPASGNSSKLEPSSQVNRGPKNLGRSDRSLVLPHSLDRIFGTRAVMIDLMQDRCIWIPSVNEMRHHQGTRVGMASSARNNPIARGKIAETTAR